MKLGLWLRLKIIWNTPETIAAICDAHNANAKIVSDCSNHNAMASVDMVNVMRRLKALEPTAEIIDLKKSDAAIVTEDAAAALKGSQS